MSNLPKTEEEAKWWKIGYEAGIKEISQKKAGAIKIGETILEEVYELLNKRD